MDMVLEFPDGADECGPLSLSRSRIVDHKADIEVSCLKMGGRWKWEMLVKMFVNKW